MTDDYSIPAPGATGSASQPGQGDFDTLAGLFFQAFADGLLAVDVRSGTILRGNPSAEHLFGFEAGGLRGVALHTLMEIPATRTDWISKLSYSAEVQAGVQMNRADGAKFLADVRASLVDLAGAATLLISVREREALTAPQTTLSTMLTGGMPREGSAKALREKNEFSSIVSHTVRTPLAVILSSVSMLTRYTDQITPERRTEHLRRIEQQVHNLSDFLYDLRMMTRIEAGLVSINRTPVDINELLAYVLNLFESYPQQPKITVDLATEGVTCLIDRDLLKPALFAVIKNAIVYSPESSTIHIKAGVSKGMLMVTVEDHGSGMPPEFIGKAFEPFLRGSNTAGVQGAGLGLTAARSALSLMGGIISLQSVVDRGTTVTLVLPVG